MLNLYMLASAQDPIFLKYLNTMVKIHGLGVLKALRKFTLKKVVEISFIARPCSV